MTDEPEAPAAIVARPGTVYDPTKTYAEYTGEVGSDHLPLMGWLIYEDGDVSDRTPDKVLCPPRSRIFNYADVNFLTGLPQSGPSISVANDCSDLSWGDRPQEDLLWRGNYVDYAGAVSADPVNQLPYMRVWERHVAQMAHDVHQFSLDAGEHRLPASWSVVPGAEHSPETKIRNQNTLQVFRAIIGYALRKLDAWSKLAPEGHAQFTYDWGQQLEGIRAIIEDKLCQACEHPYSAREFHRLHNYSAWRTVLDHRRILDDRGSAKMRVPLIVRDDVPWTPHATEDLTFFGGSSTELVDAGWREAIEWFDEAVHRYDRKYAPRYQAGTV